MVELKRFLFFASVYEVQDLVASVIKRTKSTADETHVTRDRIRRRAVYKAGEKVRVERNAEWVDAYVVAFDSRITEYQIEYEDTGQKLDHVKHEQIRERHSTVFFRGERVRAQFNKGTKWYVVFERVYSSAKRENIYLLILHLRTRITYITHKCLLTRITFSYPSLTIITTRMLRKT